MRTARFRARTIAEHGPHRVVVLPGSFSAAMAAWLSGCPHRIGYAREGRGLLLTNPLTHPSDFRNRHRVRYFLDLLPLVAEGAIGGDDASPERTPLEFVVDARARAWASSWLDDVRLSRPVVGIHLGAAFGPSKRWPVEDFQATLERLARQLGSFTTIVVGGPDERRAAETLQSALPDIHVLPAAGVTTGIVELAALVEKCDVFLSNDSGPMHVAAALGTPQVAVFTSTNPAFTAPWNPRATVIAADLSCAPCFARNCRRVGGSRFPCHDAVSPDRVAEAVLERLQSSNGNATS